MNKEILTSKERTEIGWIIVVLTSTGDKEFAGLHEIIEGFQIYTFAKRKRKS